MANIQIKRRNGGAAGAPSTLKSGELAYNTADDTLYIGHGDDGGGAATSIPPIGGKGAFADVTSVQTIAGKKTFSTVPAASADASAGADLVRKSQVDTLLGAKANLVSPALTGTPTAPTASPDDNSTKIATTAYADAAAAAAAGIGDMTKAVYDPNDDGKVVAADSADAAPWSGITGKPSTFAPSAHTHATSEVTGLDAALAAKAPLASPALTGTPTAPTAAGGTDNTQLATTAFVIGEITSIIAAAPAALDTLNELAAALGDDADFAGTMTANLATKAAKSANLSDLVDVSAARTNLGLGSLALQAASAVSITGGTISGATIDGGTF